MNQKKKKTFCILESTAPVPLSYTQYRSGSKDQWGVNFLLELTSTIVIAQVTLKLIVNCYDEAKRTTFCV